MLSSLTYVIKNLIGLLSMDDQTEKICIEKVKQNGYALKYVENQTEAICMEAVKQNGDALEYVRHQTEAICMEAVEEDGRALKYVKNQTEDICMVSVKQNGFALKYVKNQTNTICMEAVKKNGLALEYVKNQTEDICMEAVKQNAFALTYVKNQTDAIYLEVIDNYFKQNIWYTFGTVYRTIKYPSPQLIIQFVKLYPSYTDVLINSYAQNIMATYKAGSDAIVAHLVQHANDLLYKPNSVNALVSHVRWHTTTTNAKTLFLTQKN